MPSGSGTEADPYLIASFENLLWVSEHSESWASYFMQTADIDASASSTLNGGYGFFPIGYAGYNFTGTYLGQKHTISGLYQNITEGGVIALFGQCSFATIKTLDLPPYYHRQQLCCSLYWHKRWKCYTKLLCQRGTISAHITLVELWVLLGAHRELF
jgi:hypothetical protein